ncbi:DUF1761 domain-containing protein [Candidatus Nomurabacteria bacterium]|nr:DUF1761 domain-containing protein [Candidatus Nomurabacteria bacterium]
MADLNYFVILIAAVVSMALGMIWYSQRAFGAHWAKLQGISKEEMEAGSKEGMGLTILTGFLLQVVVAGAFNYTLNVSGINPYCVALLFAIGVMFPVMADGSLWEKRPWGIFWINFSYRLVSLLVTALIFSIA